MNKWLFVVLLFFTVVLAQIPKFSDAVEIKAGSNATIKIPHATPCVVDWNEDGEKDLLLGQYTDGKINFFENTGTDKSPVLKVPVFLQAGGVDITLAFG